MTPDYTPSSPTVGAETTEQHLRRFYVELQAWIEGGCGAHGFFRTHQPICDQLMDWESHERVDGLLRMAKQQFEDAGLHRYSPFDQGLGIDIAIRDHTVYANPSRLAWIKAHASPALSNGEHSRGGE